ncbi:MAG: hypothetical protein ACRDAQ_05880, partial [Cetobacterium sp.]
FALGNFFNTPAVKIIEVNGIEQLEENVYAQKIKYQTYNSFGGQIIEEKIFILKKVDNKVSFIEKLNTTDLSI